MRMLSVYSQPYEPRLKAQMMYNFMEVTLYLRIQSQVKKRGSKWQHLRSGGQPDIVSGKSNKVHGFDAYCDIYRVQHNYPLKTGHKTILWCCQDEDKKQKSRPSQKEGVKHRDTIGMKRFPCRSALTISCCNRMGNQINARTLSIRMRHHDAHVPYYDVAMPSDATQIIRDQLEWSSPSSLAPKIQALYPRITASQVHFAWTKMSEILWKKDSDQLTSAKMLLDEFGRDIDVFDVELADGVEQLCWGMKKITRRLEGKVVEIGLDATCE